MGQLFDKLTAIDKTKIDKYIGYCVGDHADLEYLLSEWDKRKELLFHKFGDQFIISKEVTITKGLHELACDMNDVIWGDHSDFIRRINRLVVDLDEFESNDPEMRTIRWDQRPSKKFGQLLEPVILAENKCPSAFALTIPDTGEVIKICAGAKVTKILNKIAKAYFGDKYIEEEYEDFRLRHSQILNQKALKGTFCLSIHPLDYMTMSDNNCDWDSCMSWLNDGCYRQGTVEMMNSPMVVVGYLTASEEMSLPYHGDGTEDLRWNNKKWRQLFIVDNNIISNVKAYPYRNDSLTKTGIDWLRELMGAENYFDEYCDWESGWCAMLDDKSYSFEPETCYMYNDFENSNGLFCYVGKNCPPYYQFCYSGASECMNCGKLNCDFGGEETRLVCYDCEPSYYCAECGDHYYSSDDMYELDGEYYCEYCYNDVATIDSITDEVHHVGNMYNIALGFTDVNGEAVIFNICDSEVKIHFNTESEILEKYFGSKSLHHVQVWCSNYYYADLDEITEDGWKLFGMQSVQDILQEIEEPYNICLINQTTTINDVTALIEALKAKYTEAQKASVA